MANLYTSSPLGLIDDINIIYQENNNKLETLFSSFKDGQNKHFLRRSSKSFRGILSQSPHSDEIYDISTTNIIEKLKGIPHLQLRYGDFAYLQDYGVYPNNRLIIARRFRNGIKDDLYAENGNNIGAPLATVIGYIKESDDFLNFNFSEQWGEAGVSFKDILNDVGKDFRLDKFVQLGDYLEKGAGIVPLPGASELFQRQIMAKLGIISDNGEEVEYKDGKFVSKSTGNEVAGQIPVGDPNLIKSAKQRKLGQPGQPFEGLKGSFNVTFTVKYEQKFLNGNDPTLVYADILHNLLNMGTSRATFYLGKNTDSSNDISKFFDELYKDPIGKIGDVIESLIDSLKEATDKLKSKLSSLVNQVKEEGFISTTKDVFGELGSEITEITTNIINNIKDFLKNKYRLRILGVINALTGAPSTPWHITIGNPLRPIFCSGDMLCDDVTIKLGPQLSFNDLPTFIEATIKYSSARALGLQEIFAKLNAGGIRTTEGVTDRDSYDYQISISEDFFTNAGPVNPITNFPDEELTSGTEFVSQTLSSQATDATNTQNLNNTSSTRRPESPLSLSTINITSVQSSSQVNPDSFSSEFILDAGQNSESEILREDNNQETTGNTEGFVSQVEEPTNSPNSGLNANTDIDGQYAKPNTPKWEVGKRVNRGSFNSGGIVVTWEVRQDSTPGFYETYLNNDPTYSGTDLEVMTNYARDDAESEFKYLTSLV